jgi:hypothetical protein
MDAGSCLKGTAVAAIEFAAYGDNAIHSCAFSADDERISFENGMLAVLECFLLNLGSILLLVSCCVYFLCAARTFFCLENILSCRIRFLENFIFNVFG